MNLCDKILIYFLLSIFLYVVKFLKLMHIILWDNLLDESIFLSTKWEWVGGRQESGWREERAAIVGLLNE